MEFNNQMFEWQNEGTEPSTDLKTNGFQGGYKPPADVFNNFWSKTTKAITELQTNLADVEDGANNYTLPIGGTEIGGVKNGGNVTINSDGTMTSSSTEIAVDDALSSTSTNPVQNKAISAALDAKVNKTNAIIDNKLYVQTGTANNANATMPYASMFPASDGTYITFDHPTKIPTSLRIKDQSLYLEYDDVEYKVYPPTIDAALSRTSTNPVQNKMVLAALDTKVNTTEASVNENFVVVGADYLTTGKIETDSSGKVTFTADNSTDYTYQSIVLDSLNSDMPKLNRGSILTGETEEGYFYTELNPPSGTSVVTATSTNGTAYTATVNGVTELYTGLSITIIPNRVSASATPTLNVNSLGAKSIKIPVGYNTNLAQAAPVATWLQANKPVRVTYDGTQWKTDLQLASATALYGTVPISKGGTGATTAEGALANLGLDSVTQIEYGSYVGTGNYGSSSKNSLTFGFVPKIVFVRQGNDCASMEAIYGATKSGYYSGNWFTQTLTWSSQTLSWYSTSAYDQLNNSSTTYYYVAIG